MTYTNDRDHTAADIVDDFVRVLTTGTDDDVADFFVKLIDDTDEEGTEEEDAE